MYPIVWASLNGFCLLRAEQYGLPYSASSALAALMLSNFLKFLDQTDVTQVTWAQYMDVTCCNGTGLLDYYGNARPSWHAFRFWGDIPVERAVSPAADPPSESSPHLKLLTHRIEASNVEHRSSEFQTTPDRFQSGALTSLFKKTKLKCNQNPQSTAVLLL